MAIDYYASDVPGVRGWIQEYCGRALLNLINIIPTSVIKKSPNPQETSQELTRKACIAAGLQSATLTLPAGPFGILTAVPDLLNVWRIQAQLIADIAACHGRPHAISKNEMAWCLFRHSASQISRDFLVHNSERLLVATLSGKALTSILRRIGAHSVERLSGRLAIRFIPILGMGISGGLAWWDTHQVGKTALKLFSEQDPTIAPP
jgi:hypothetical protein